MNYEQKVFVESKYFKFNGEYESPKEILGELGKFRALVMMQRQELVDLKNVLCETQKEVARVQLECELAKFERDQTIEVLRLKSKSKPWWRFWK